MTTTQEICDFLTRTFGTLTPNTHPYYSEEAGDVLWTERYTTPMGLQYQMVFTIYEADEESPTQFTVDFWWFPPSLIGTMQGHEVMDIEGIGNVYTTEADAHRLRHVVETRMVPFIEDEHAKMMARLYWIKMLEPSHMASGVPEQGLRYLMSIYTEDAIKNPEAMSQIYAWFKVQKNNPSA